MASIPLPALDIRPPAPPPNPVDQYAQIEGIRSLLQQQQAQGEQLTAAKLENQQRQIQLQDQQAMTAAMKEWDGKDFGALPNLALKNGASADSVLKLQQGITAQQKSLADLTKEQLSNEKTKNDYFAAQIDGVKSLPEDEQPSAFEKAKADAVSKGFISPQEAQGMVYQSPQQLDMMEKTLLGHAAMVDQATKESEQKKNLAAASASEWKTFPEMGIMVNTKTNEVRSVAPGGPIMSPAQMQSKYVNLQAQQEQGQPISPSDKAWLKGFEKFKTLVPQFNINMASQMTPQSLDQVATQFAQTGQLPPLGYGATGTILRQKILNRAAELFPQNNLALAKAAYGSSEGALKHIQTQASTIETFESTAIKNIDQALNAASKIPDLGARFANVPVRLISDRMVGTPEMAKFRAALLTAQTETAKVLSTVTGSGALTDAARNEVNQILSGNMTYPAMKAAFEQLKTDMSNRRASYSEQIDQLKGEIANQGKPATAAPQGGGQGSGLIYARDPSGKLHSAPAGTALPKGWTQAKGPNE